MRIGSYSIIKTSKLENQERAFEANLEAERSIWMQSNKELSELLEDAEYTLKAAQANEQLLNNQTGKLAQKLHSAITFPDKNFSVSKGVNLLTTKLSDKLLATFLYKLVEKLSQSHLESTLKYVNNQLESIKSNNGNKEKKI